MQNYDLSVCVVLYKPNLGILNDTISSLNDSLKNLSGLKYKVYLVDNTASCLPDEVKSRLSKVVEFIYIHGHGNIGFAAANNLVLNYGIGKYHLCLNPDVILNKNAVANAFSSMESDLSIGMLTPACFDPNGMRQYLVKRFPSPFVLLLRGFIPKAIKKYFIRTLERYECVDKNHEKAFVDIRIASGCFMFFRSSVFKTLNGFDQRFFLYFEDFDLSIRVSDISKILYDPTVLIIHYGGNAGKKGLKHVRLFVTSAFKFYLKHGLISKQ